MRCICVVVATAAIVAYAVATTPVSRNMHTDSAWFGELVAADIARQTHHTGGATHRAHQELCCHRLSLQEDVDGEPVEHLDVPYNYWWRHAGVLLSASTSLTEPAQRTLRLTPQGLLLDAAQSHHAYLRLQCSYACCLEAVVVVRPSGVRTPPQVFGGVMANHTIDATQDEAWVHVGSGGGKRTVGAHIRNRVASGLYDSRGIPEIYMFGAKSRLQRRQQQLHNDQRYETMTLCDRNNTGLFVHVQLTERAQYAISEIDLCFVDHKLAMEWGTGFCTDTDSDAERREFWSDADAAETPPPDAR
jgi:hypothetical protein